MTKEELIKNQFPNDEFLRSAVSQIVDKCTAELERKISVLLSCKNCPKNKGGLICQKEYENKCLAQKIEFIKELQQENAELKEKLNNLASVAEVRLANWQNFEKENTELKKQLEMSNKVYNDNLDYSYSIEGQLKQAKEIIKRFSAIRKTPYLEGEEELFAEAEQFIKDSEVEKNDRSKNLCSRHLF